MIVIVGAGIGGLVTALRLHHDGVDCVVYEQADPVRELGVGINLLPHIVEQLAALGLADGLAETGVRTRELIYTHRLGHEIMRRDCGTSAGFAFPQYSLHRGRLQGLLLRAVRSRLGPGAVRPGHRLVGFSQDSGAVHAHFVDRHGDPLAAVRGDALVAADGIHSTVRSLMFPSEGPPRWNGVLMWRGAVDWPEYGTGRSMVIAGGTAAKLVIYPIAPGREPGTRLTNWAICVQLGRPGDPPPSRQEWATLADRSDLERHVDLFHTSMLDHRGLVLAEQDAYEFPMCDRDPLPYWTQGRVTLLGDAAHPMYPMGSNGAGQAILDATSLADNLTRHPVPDALAAYEQDRLAATADVVLRNRKGGPEMVIDEVERRAPNGFARIEDVMDASEMQSIVASYLKASGAVIPRP